MTTTTHHDTPDPGSNSTPSTSTDAGAESARTRGASTLLVGLPGAGKTSYLGLLFVSLVRGSNDGPLLALYDEDRAYLNRIAARLQKFEPATRTQVGDGEGLNLTLNVPGHDQPLKLAVPDLSGETWETAHVERVLPKTTWDLATDAAGFVVFANTAEFDDAPTIEESHAAAADLGLGDDDWTETAETGDPNGPSPTQIALVDLIQILSGTQHGPVHLSIVLSAYDTVNRAVSRTPAAWLEECAPLLTQYLRVNARKIQFRVYGASAQGGDYSDASPIDELAEKPLLERAFVLDSAGKAVPVAAPLLWALGDA